MIANSSMATDIDDEGRLQSFLQEFTSNINFISIISVGIVVGIIVNYIYDLQTIFDGACFKPFIFKSPSGIGLYYSFSILFFTCSAYLSYKYTMLTINYDKIKKLFYDSNEEKLEVVYRVKHLLNNYMKDKFRYFAVISYVTFLFINKIFITTTFAELNIQFRLSFIFILLYISLIIFIELPTFFLSRMYFMNFETPSTNPEEMKF